MHRTAVLQGGKTVCPWKKIALKKILLQVADLAVHERDLTTGRDGGGRARMEARASIGGLMPALPRQNGRGVGDMCVPK